MQISGPELVWHWAEFVIAIEFEGDIPHDHQIQAYLLKAGSPEVTLCVFIALQLTRQTHWDEENRRFALRLASGDLGR